MTAPEEFFHGHTNVLQELTRVGGSSWVIPDTFQDPCCVQFLEWWERKSDLTAAPLNSFMVTQIYCMSFQELVLHRLVKVPWHLTIIQMLFTIMDYVFAPVMTVGMLEILVEDFYSKRCLVLQLQYLFHLPIKCVVDTLNNMFIICCMKWMHI